MDSSPLPEARVVVIEDDDDIRALIVDILSTAGMDVAGAGRLADGIAAAGEARPSLLIVDLKLPDAAGPDTVRRLRAHPTVAEVPIIVVSGEINGPVIAAVMAAGASRYLPKPFSTASLLEAVRATLSPPPA